MTALLVVLCVLVTWLAVRRLLKGTPADTLRPKAPKGFRHGLLEHTKLWRRAGFNIQWNLRDASRNRARSLMAIVGVFGCTALIVCALGMSGSMEDLKVWQYETINRFESKLLLKETVTPEQINEVKNAIHGEAVMEGAIEVRASGVKKSASLTVTDHVTLIRPTDINRQPVALPEDGISLTAKTAGLLGVGQGDTVEWHIYGNEGWIQSEIAAICREPVTQGIFMSRVHFESLGFTFRPTALVTAEKVTTNFDGVDTILSTTDIIKGWDDLTEAMYIMVYLLIAAAAVLSVVVLYNLGLLSFTEMERELATLKVMGLKSRKLRELLLTQNLWFSAMGFLLGVPGGIWLIQVIVSFSGESFDFPVELRAPTLLISFVFTFGLSILVNLLFSRKIRRLNMVEALKAME
jgi:putative ABC transport system permease protein